MTNQLPEPCYDIAHLAHVEMYTDKFEESLDFFVNVYGLTVSDQDEDHAWLRAWDDYEFHTLKLTRHHTTGVGHIAYRASSEAALMRRVAVIEASEYQVIGWVEDDRAHGRAFRFSDPLATFLRFTTIPCVMRPKEMSVPRLKTWRSAITGAARRLAV